MPTVLRVGPYRFFFFSNEGTEPPQIHVGASGACAKYWLNPMRIERSTGFRAHQLAEIRRKVEDSHVLFEDKWNEFFGDS